MRSRLFLYVALITDILITVTKFVAAAFTRSSAMVSEGIHSVIDSISQLLLLWGVRVSRKKPDDRRPFGYGRELYFWSFIVSLIIFVMGGCLSFYEGLLRFRRPSVSDHEAWSYAVLLAAFVFTSISAYASLKAFNKQRGDVPFWKAVRDSKDPAVFIVLLGDIGDLAGLAVAFLGISLTYFTHDYRYDGVASIIIGAILIIISFILVRESRSLLMGEAIGKRTVRRIIMLIESDASVVKVKQHLSTYMAPEDVVLQLVTVFKNNLTTQQITDAIARISQTITKKFPRVKQIFIEPAAA